MTSRLLLLALGTAAGVHAQSWDCLRAAERPFFTNQSGYVRAIKIDSVTSAGGSRIFWPYRSPRGKWAGLSLDTNGGSWVGRRVEARSNGVWAFDTRFGDTVFINTAAGIGSSWRFYDDTSNRYFTATVLSETATTVGGVPDSVKQISIRAFLTGGMPVADTVDGLQIVLSKQRGFLVVPDLHSFPYSNGAPSRNGIALKSDYYTELLSSGTGLQKSVVTFARSDFRYPQHAKLYPHLPGSVYHYQARGAFRDAISVFTWREIDSIGSDGTVYCRKWEDVMDQVPYVRYSTFTRSSLLTGPAVIDTTLVPETVNARIWYYYPALHTALPLTVPFKYRSEWNYIGRDLAGRYYVAGLEPCALGDDLCLVDTLGTVQETNCWEPPSGSNTLQLVYARIGSQSFGTPLQAAEAHVEPENPTWHLSADGQTLVIRLGGEETNRAVALVDLSGKPVYRGTIGGATAEISVGLLPRGVYLLAVQGRNGARRFLKVALP